MSGGFGAMNGGSPWTGGGRGGDPWSGRIALTAALGPRRLGGRHRARPAVPRRRRGPLGTLAAAVVVVTLAVLPGATPATATARAGETEVCDKYGSTPVAGGRYEVQNSRWGSDDRQCVVAFDTGFRVEADHHNEDGPAAYPSLVFGCNYGNCTRDSPFPRPVSDLGDVRSSWATTTPGRGDYNVAYDIWFDPAARRDGAPTGLELMVWLRHTDRVQPIGDRTGEVVIDGVGYDVWRGENGVPVISYVRQQPTNEVRDLSITAFTADAAQRGLLPPAWFLTSVQAGFEPWIGGDGLATTSYSVTRDGR